MGILQNQVQKVLLSRFLRQGRQDLERPEKDILTHVFNLDLAPQIQPGLLTQIQFQLGLDLFKEGATGMGVPVNRFGQNSRKMFTFRRR